MVSEPDKTLERARSRALLLLEHRERSRREMEERLLRAGFQAAVVQEVVEWLEGLSYLDDVRFARNYAAGKLRAGWGPIRIRRELSLKGVGAEAVDHALESHVSEEDGAGRSSDLERALVAGLRRRFRQASAGDSRAARRKAAAYLARRGHEWPDIQRILGLVFEDMEAEEDWEGVSD